jgi:LysM repeat protein
MAETQLMNALDDSINRLAAGQTIEDCLRRYPQYAIDLRTMLEVGAVVRRSRLSQSEIQQAQDRVRYRIAQAAEMPRPRAQNRQRLSLLPLVAGLVLVFMIMLSAATFASQGSIPGDPLYGLKRLSEAARLALENDASLRQQFDSRRVDETRQLLNLGREADVTFDGQVQKIDDANWQIAGLSLQVIDDMPGIAAIQIGSLVEVEARTTAQRQLIALSIQLIQPPVEVTPQVTETPISEITPEAIEAVTAEVTPTPSEEVAITPEVTATPSGECEPNPPDDWIIYQIQPDDTLSRLAAETGTTVTEIVEANCIANPTLITIGQIIYLPSQPQKRENGSSGDSSGGITGGSPTDTGVLPTEDRGSGSDGGSGSDDSSGRGSNSGGSGSDGGSGGG